MSRLAYLLKHAEPTGPWLEIAPYFNPAVPKRDGHDVRILDVFDTDTLRARAKADSHIPDARIDEIEEVDFVGDACRIGELLQGDAMDGQFQLIISSHNFEHLPNPILFLQGCEAALRPGGMLSMAIPDCRACFDHFRYPSRLSDWLEAYHRDRRQPSPETIFDAQSNFAAYRRGEAAGPSCDIASDDPRNFVLSNEVTDIYRDYLARLEGDPEYTDTHCNTLFPEVFELLIHDLRRIGLVGLELAEVSSTRSHEFFVHLRKPLSATAEDAATAQRRRTELLRRISWRLGAAPYRATPLRLANRARKGAERSFTALMRKLVPAETFSRVDAWNRRRLNRRRRG